MDIEGKIVKLLEEQKGEGRNGTWRKKEYVLETEDKFPKKICFNLWGDRIDEFAVKEGDQVRVFFDLESREFNGRWYTDVKAWKIENVAQSGSGYPEEPEMGNSGPLDTPPPLTEAWDNFEEKPIEDDLPF